MFEENTAENIANLIEEYDCADYITELLESPGIADDELTDGGGMYQGCPISPATVK